MFSSSIERGKRSNVVRHPLVHSDHRDFVTAGSIVPISAVEAVEFAQHKQPAALSSVRMHAKRAYPAHSWVEVPYPYVRAGSSRHDSGIAEARSSAYLERDRHSQSISSDPLRVGTAPIREHSSSYSVHSRSQFPSEHTHSNIPLSDSTERWRDGFIAEARGTWLPAGNTDQVRSNLSVSSPNSTSVTTSSSTNVKTMHHLLKLQTFDGTGSLDTLNKFNQIPTLG